MYTKPTPIAKKILIETETIETLRLRLTGPATIRVFCVDCGAMEEMLDLNSAADISGERARELLRRVDAGELHSPEISSGHLLICRAALERSINTGPNMRLLASMLGDKL